MRDADVVVRAGHERERGGDDEEEGEAAAASCVRSQRRSSAPGASGVAVDPSLDLGDPLVGS